MRRALVVGRFGFATRRSRTNPVAQCAQFAPEPRDVFRHFEHRFVLLGDVTLQIRDLLFETFSFLAQLSESAAASP